MNAIACRGLTKRYRDVPVVDGLDVDVAEGELFGFLGPNGAGKTTTLRMLLGLVRPTSGTAWVNGHRVPYPAGLRDIGAMVEEPGFYPWLSGRDNLRVLAGTGAPVAPGAIEEAMARTGIAAAAGRRVRAYSQGMRQRLGLAAALLRRPRLLVLDEPTNGLDPAGIRDFRQLLREEVAAGTTVLLSSHLLTEVEQLCGRVAVLNRGRLVRTGSLAELGRGGTVQVEVHPALAKRAATALRPIGGRPVGHGLLEVAGGSGSAVARMLAAADVYPETLSVRHTSLEELFMALTEGEPHATAPR